MSWQGDSYDDAFARLDGSVRKLEVRIARLTLISALCALLACSAVCWVVFSSKRSYARFSLCENGLVLDRDTGHLLKPNGERFTGFHVK